MDARTRGLLKQRVQHRRAGVWLAVGWDGVQHLYASRGDSRNVG